jgi:hypothetical protein
MGWGVFTLLYYLFICLVGQPEEGFGGKYQVARERFIFHGWHTGEPSLPAKLD